MSMSVADTTTIVGDRDTFRKEQELSLHPKDTSHASTFGKRRAPSHPDSTEDRFATTLDYMSEDRPFFVKIGKEGLIAALDKLDRQLVQVSMLLYLSYISTYTVSIVWTHQSSL